ncbi:MAG: hypothetical protein M3Q73_03475 [bacterium]|nr:hypothetical protein [bacterium]
MCQKNGLVREAIAAAGTDAVSFFRWCAKQYNLQNADAVARRLNDELAADQPLDIEPVYNTAFDVVMGRVQVAVT